MPRILFEKTGNAVWMSHLDLMRLFQRAFKRAGFPLVHTNGFNPRPSVSIALPMSVGIESVCELLDFELDCETVDFDQLRDQLNSALVPGVRVIQAYDTGRKLKELSYLNCAVSLEYDHGVPECAQNKLRQLFQQESLIVPKKGKNGTTDQQIAPLIKRIEIVEAGEKELIIDTVVCCQNPTLNPMQLVAAIDIYLPECKPDFAKCKRIEILDVNYIVFR